MMTGVLQPSGKIAQVQQDHHYQSQHIDFSMPFDPKVLIHSDTESSEFDFQNDQQPEQATTYQVKKINSTDMFLFWVLHRSLF